MRGNTRSRCSTSKWENNGKAHFSDGITLLKKHSELLSTREELEKQRQTLANSLEEWAPIWERSDEVAVYRKIGEVDREIEVTHRAARASFAQAVAAAPADSSYATDALQALRSMDESPARENQRVEISSQPVQADVYCFRYKSYEERLLPLPFDLRKVGEGVEAAVIGRPFLQIVQARDSSPFEVGDRLMRVDGEEVSLRGELAKVLSDVSTGQTVQVEVQRDGEQQSFSWIPVRADTPAGGSIDSLSRRFGLVFAGYPLEFLDGCRLGVTGVEPLAVDFAPGKLPFGVSKGWLRRYAVSNFGFADA